MRSRAVDPPTSGIPLWSGIAALGLGLFITIARELFGRELDGLDRVIIMAVAEMRAPWLTGVVVDLTALGSLTLITLFTLVPLGVLLLSNDGIRALQLLTASSGAGLWTLLIKDAFERRRPIEVAHLVEQPGFSYPSGHSLAGAALYLTLAMIAGRQVRSPRARVALAALAAVVISLVAFSRVYLGVHYPSDVAAGVAFGAAWALLLAAGFSRLDRRGREGET
jgi:undecaprenyl-diphosphatase